MQLRKYLQNGLIGATAVLVVGAPRIPGARDNGPVLRAALAAVSASPKMTASAEPSPVAEQTHAAIEALSSAVRTLSHPKALETAFHGYFAFKAAHPDEVKKPYLYFVDYGLPSTEPRGYVFDMSTLQIVDGPFTVAHGRGSSSARYGVPTRFSNGSGSYATSLGLYLTGNTYQFHGKTGGRSYSSIGLELLGESRGFNDNARERRVVAHGAPYVTPSQAGRSEGCPAMEPQRAQKLLPRLADGGVVFLFAPNQDWMTRDPWVAASAEN